MLTYSRSSPYAARLSRRSPALNAWLGAALVVANGLLFYGYFFFFDVSENDRLFYGPVLVSFLAAQWLVLARTITYVGPE